MAEESSSGITGAIAAVINGIQKVVDKIDQFVDWWFELMPRFFKALLTLLQDVFLWCLEQCFSLAKSALDGITGLDTMAAEAARTWALVPTDVIVVLQTIGLGTALGIVTAAIVIRLMLQLIPFTRLGS
ncbi:DUF2523 family protein [Paracidovorax konjaci]|uniref:DUF2523 domain-containing protein n=1 Tax=Paracidovorax konjaci TaxID=32040 RepID=A0A1I1XUV9_9BURK|nr:DUF2523 family protein [Paracidovorax konjaci]SFE11135.1 Protein of unknown function [Paracidovorax konjaci]